VLPPHESWVPAAAEWAVEILTDPERAADIGARSRLLAEQRFGMKQCADQFENVLESVAR
jgi:glycosyltransferase involved in cell wall biosynthesis